MNSNLNFGVPVLRRQSQADAVLAGDQHVHVSHLCPTLRRPLQALSVPAIRRGFCQYDLCGLWLSSLPVALH